MGDALTLRRVSPPLFMGLILWAFSSCGPPEQNPEIERIDLFEIAPSTVLPGTTLRFTGEGFLPGETVHARFEGLFAGQECATEHRLTYVSPTQQLLRVGNRLITESSATEGNFTGTVGLWVERDGATLEAGLSTTLAFATSLQPQLLRVQPGALSFMESVVVEGSGFLFPTEGATRVILDGSFREDGAGSREVSSVEIPSTVTARGRIEAPWLPEILGLATGAFEGTVKLINDHSGPGGRTESSTLPFDFLVLRPSVASLMPPAASRGQALGLLGRGFLPSASDKDQSTFFTVDGIFETVEEDLVDWMDQRALIIEGTWKEPGRIDHVIRPQRDGRGGLEGLGHRPGLFVGSVTPTIRHQGRSLEGAPFEGGFEIAPTLQVVYLKYLPTFSEALRKFGLRNVEREVRARILEVCRRDYADYNVDFRDARPTDFVDYSIIELAGRDPNQLGLFGLDNSEGMDDGNLRLDDVIGGHNAETEEQGHFSYGGVFLESFLAFSPTLGLGHLPEEFRSSRFDHLFSHFIPELDGVPVAADEYPGGTRDPQISQAIRALGSILGNTVVHEIGHSLGMVSIPGQYHHDGTSLGLIMNPGQARSFEERAEIDGQGPAIWHEIDRDYLQQVLPKSY